MLWDQIDGVDKKDADCTQRIEKLLDDRGKTARQQLFLYSLIKSNFSMSEARRKVNISQRILAKWLDDEDFNELMNGVLECKKDFIESSLMGLIKSGDSSATIFASKTLNRDRGYSDRVDVNINIKKTVNKVKVEELPLEIRMEILKQIREKEELSIPKLTVQPDTVDAEFTEINPEITNNP